MEQEITITNIESALEELQNLQGLEADERKLRLSELKERFRLLGLYEQAKQNEAADGSVAAEELELAEVRGHLEPLGLAPAGTPVAELARLAALEITKK